MVSKNTKYVLISDIDYDDGVWGYASGMPKHPKVTKYYACFRNAKNQITAKLISRDDLTKDASTHFTISQTIEVQKLVFNCLNTVSPMALNAPSQSFARQQGAQGIASPFIPVPVNLIATVPKQAIRDLLIDETGIEQAMFGGEAPVELDELHLTVNDDVIKYMKKHVKHPHLTSKKKKRAIRKQWKPSNQSTKDAMKKLQKLASEVRKVTVPLVKNRIQRDTKFLINAQKIYKKSKPKFIKGSKYLLIHKYNKSNHTYNVITNSNIGKVPVKNRNVTKDKLVSQPSFSYRQIVKLRKHIFDTGKYDDEAKVQPKHDYRNYEFAIVPVNEIDLVTPQRIQFILKDEANRTAYNFVNSDELTVQEWLVENSKMLIRYQISRNNIQLHEKVTDNDTKNLPSVYNYNFGYDNG